MQSASLFLAAYDSGAYISLGKMIPVLIVLLLWARLLSWADKDAVRALLPREWLNLGMLLGLIVAFILFLMLPSYGAALPVLIVVMLLEVGAYLGIRNSKVGLKDLKDDFRNWVAHKRGTDSVKVLAGAVTFFDPGGKGGPLPVPDSEAPERASYDGAQALLTDPLRKNAERIDVKPSEGASQVSFVVDGFPWPAPSMDRGTSAAVANYLKPLAKLSLEEKRKPQHGSLRVQLDGKKRDLDLNTAGSSAGESFSILVEPKKRQSLTIDKLGFTADQLQVVKASIQDAQGIVILTAPKMSGGAGLTTMLYAVLRAHDAFLEHIQTIERAADQDLEGITQNKLAANATAADEAKQVNWTVSQEPDVLMINKIVDPGTARDLIEFVAHPGEGKHRRVYIAMTAGNSFDALAIWRKLVGDDALALRQLKMIIAGRVMRKLCNACKIAYAPDPEQLKKLNLNPANSDRLFQARREPLRDPKGNPITCEFCKDLRYTGRTGFYEIMTFDDDMRAVITGGGSSSQIKAAFRKKKGRLLQEMALAAVETGDTSLAEVKRVMEAGEAGGPSASQARAPSRR
jgi:type II secretory ATPase GspE/PulE/Tfp pilus assembly ATPase PilB-like protein